MITWSFKPLALALALVVTGCGEDGAMLSFLEPADAAPEKEVANSGLKSAPMLRGVIELTPPKGFCIDRRSLKRNFALLARCDVLGAPDTAGGPDGIVTVSLVRRAGEADLDTTLIALAPEASVIERDSSDGLALALMDGPTPDGTAARHWRGVAQIGPVVMGLAAYGSDNDAEESARRAGVLRDLVAQTRAASGAEKAEASEADPAPRQGLGKMLSELFE